MKYQVFLLGILFIVGCSPKVANNQQSGYSMEFLTAANDALGIKDLDFMENSAGDYVLCTFMKSSEVPGSEPLKIAVIERGTNKVTYKTSVSNGSVKWIDAYKIELVSPPGIPNGNQATVDDYTYVIDVETSEKVKKNSSEAKN